ncbi:hypothetical protein [Kangiella shandongensis]|uniref:hypothetical protein n=1 Tax=Kangiella shandongensis TaxID=2763258 RepID=UPI001CBD208B|nr:hypothetical protein [Kangiella shandongensis]
MRRLGIKSICTLLLAIAYSHLIFNTVQAHSFGERYDLPLPLSMYLTSAAVVVLVSFVITAVFLRQSRLANLSPYIELKSFLPRGSLSRKIITSILQLIGVTLFALTLVTAYVGDNNTFNNFSPTFVWIIWWVGFTFIVALVGNFWPALNPWRTLALWSHLFKVKSHRPYPEKLGAWPVVIIFIIFAWLELIAQGPETPKVLFWLITIYSFYTWLGMAIFGINNWLRHGDVFSHFFNLFGRFALFNVKSDKVQLRLPGSGLTHDKPLHFSETFFVVLLLSTVSFDGILETPLWKNLLDFIAENQLIRPLLIDLQGNGIDIITLIKSLALLIVPCLLLSVFLIFCYLSVKTGGKKMSLTEAAGHYVLSLVPIALAYHIAHYIFYLMIAGQQIIPLLSDPFGYGWDIFGTKNYTMDIGVINAKTVWFISIYAIIIGHIIAVVLAHYSAIKIYQNHKQTLMSQIPMLILMIAYTMLSLWILSQPIVE